MFALLLAAMLTQDTAADIFKKVEAHYESVTSLSFTSDVRVTEIRDGKEVERGRMQARFQSKGEGRVRMEYSMLAGAKATLLATYISDGSALTIQQAGKALERKDHALALASWSRRFCARLGLTASVGPALSSILRGEGDKLGKRYPVSAIADGGKEKIGDIECRILTYEVGQFQESAPPLKCRMWVDPAKNVVLKHELVDRTVIIRETHSEIAVDAEIADDQFKIP